MPTTSDIISKKKGPSPSIDDSMDVNDVEPENINPDSMQATTISYTSPSRQSTLIHHSTKVYSRKHGCVKFNVGAESKIVLPKARKLPDLIPIFTKKNVEAPGLLDGVRDKLRKIVYGPSTLLDSTPEKHSIDINFCDPNFGTLEDSD